MVTLYELKQGAAIAAKFGTVVVNQCVFCQMDEISWYRVPS